MMLAYYSAVGFLAIVMLATGLYTPVQAGNANLCVVPIRNSEPTDTDKSRFSRFSVRLRNISKAKRPLIFWESRQPDKWTISDDHALVPYPGGDDPNFPIRFLEEKHTGRVLGERAGQLTLLDNSSGKFRPFALDTVKLNSRVRIWTYIPGWKRSIVATDSGIFFLEGRTTRPIAGSEPKVIGNVDKIIDLPTLSAVAILTDNWEGLAPEISPRRILLLTKAGQLINVVEAEPARNTDTRPFLIRMFSYFLEKLINPSAIERRSERKSSFTDISYIASLNSLIVKANKYVMLVPVTKRADNFSLGEQKIITRFKKWHDIRFLNALDSFLFLQYMPIKNDKKIRQFLRATRSGIERIKADSGLNLVLQSRIIDVPSRGIVILRGADQLYVYDGKNPAKPISGTHSRNRHYLPQIFELPGLDRVLLRRKLESGGDELLELTRQYELEPIPLPPELKGAKIRYITEMPLSDVAIMTTYKGIFAIKRSGRISSVRGHGATKDSIRANLNLPRLLPQTNEILLNTAKGLFLVVDERISGQGACADVTN